MKHLQELVALCGGRENAALGMREGIPLAVLMVGMYFIACAIA